MAKTKLRRVWIVEMLVESKWRPTVGAALTHEKAKHVIRDWRVRNPNDKFRLIKYAAEKDTRL